MKRFLWLLLIFLIPFGCSKIEGETPSNSPSPQNSESVSLDDFLELAQADPRRYSKAVTLLGDNWDDGLAGPILELVTQVHPHRGRELLKHLSSWTGQSHKTINDWFFWYWNQKERPPEWYPNYKAALYSPIDPSFTLYFKDRSGGSIDLTEVRWGGVRRDGIPPLANPKMLAIEKATYLADTDVVFGLVHKGEARAYPKRILAWHEMFRDTIGGDNIAGVYCTLCGTVIPYLAGEHTIGTSGFLFRSNKVMYDLETRSLWSTFDGQPVFGPLFGKGIKLDRLPVVTTTWGAWKKEHPDTLVLSLETGHRRDYSEGAAYREYFGTDELMFNVPYEDKRLANKDEVFILRDGQESVALGAEFLSKNPLYNSQVGKLPFLILTDEAGANMAFYDDGRQFKQTPDGKLVDQNGHNWQVTWDALLGPDGKKLDRLPGHRAFWFGWHAAHPETRLVK